MKRKVSIVLLGLMLLMSASCGLRAESQINYNEVDKPQQYVFEAFDTQCSISLYGVLDEEIAQQCYQDMKNLIDNYDSVFSKTREGSEIYDINHRTSDSVMICDETASIFAIAQSLYEWSDRRFDISAGTLIDLWDINNRTTVPTLTEINEARKHIGNYKYEIERDVAPGEFKNNRITFFGDELTQYDLGGLVKGYCCDALRTMLAENEMIKACIVNLGGNVFCSGTVDGRRGGAFNVGIFKPFSGNEIIDTLSVKNRNVITSGNYQRYFKVEGDDRIYHHIIDPLTGYPTDNGLDSVTIVSENGLLGDYLSTACMLVGEERSKDLIDFVSDTFGDKNIQATFVYSDGKITKYPKRVNITS